MNKVLEELTDRILYGDRTKEEWKEMYKQAQEAYKTATDEDLKKFIESGAGLMLEQVMEYLD